MISTEVWFADTGLSAPVAAGTDLTVFSWTALALRWWLADAPLGDALLDLGALTIDLSILADGAGSTGPGRRLRRPDRDGAQLGPPVDLAADISAVRAPALSARRSALVPALAVLGALAAAVPLAGPSAS